MNGRKRWMIAAAILIGAGLLTCGGALASLGYDYNRLSPVPYKTESFDVDGVFQNIRVTARSADVLFVPSESGSCRVVCVDDEAVTYDVHADGHDLEIKIRDDGKRHFRLGFSTQRPGITVSLPGSDYGVLSVSVTTGDVKIPADFSFEKVELGLTTGDVKCAASASGTVTVKTVTGDIVLTDMTADSLILSTASGDARCSSVQCDGDINVHTGTGSTAMEDVTCANLSSDGTTGDITLKNTVASGKLSVTRTTGDIRFDRSDADTILSKTTSGDIRGTLLTDKIFSAHSTTGNVHVPESTEGGVCELTTTTGSIRVGTGL